MRDEGLLIITTVPKIIIAIMETETNVHHEITNEGNVFISTATEHVEELREYLIPVFKKYNVTAIYKTF